MDKSVWDNAQREELDYWNVRSHDAVGVVNDLHSSFQLAELMKRTIFDREFPSALDVGVGPLGIGALWALDHIPVRVGIDPLALLPIATRSPLMNGFIEQIREGVTYHKGTAEALPFANHSFALVICNNVLDHTHNPSAILSELRRVVTDDGVLAFAVDTYSKLAFFRRRIDRKINPTKHDNYRLHPWDFTFRMMTMMLESAGFRVTASIAPTWKGSIAGRSRRSCWICDTRH